MNETREAAESGTRQRDAKGHQAEIEDGTDQVLAELVGTDI
jgi:hypothetical protein